MYSLYKPQVDSKTGQNRLQLITLASLTCKELVETSIRNNEHHSPTDKPNS